MSHHIIWSILVTVSVISTVECHCNNRLKAFRIDGTREEIKNMCIEEYNHKNKTGDYGTFDCTAFGFDQSQLPPEFRSSFSIDPPSEFTISPYQHLFNKNNSKFLVPGLKLEWKSPISGKARKLLKGFILYYQECDLNELSACSTRCYFLVMNTSAANLDGDWFKVRYEYKLDSVGFDKMIEMKIYSVPTPALDEIGSLVKTRTVQTGEVMTVSTPNPTIGSKAVSTPNSTIVSKSVSTPNPTIVSTAVSTPNPTIVSPTVSKPSPTSVSTTMSVSSSEPNSVNQDDSDILTTNQTHVVGFIGAQVSLFCKTMEKPSGEIYWYKAENKKNLSDTSGKIEIIKVERLSKLTITSLTKEDAGHYVCRFDQPEETALTFNLEVTLPEHQKVMLVVGVAVGFLLLPGLASLLYWNLWRKKGRKDTAKYCGKSENGDTVTVTRTSGKPTMAKFTFSDVQTSVTEMVPTQSQSFQEILTDIKTSSKELTPSTSQPSTSQAIDDENNCSARASKKALYLL